MSECSFYFTAPHFSPHVVVWNRTHMYFIFDGHHGLLHLIHQCDEITTESKTPLNLRRNTWRMEDVDTMKDTCRIHCLL